VLSGAAADFEHKASGRKRLREHFEYRTLVALGCAGKAAALTDVLADLPSIAIRTPLPPGEGRG